MQTFLPDKDFRKCAQILDNKRLGKQRVEAAQLIKILTRAYIHYLSPSSPWENHPAAKLWREDNNSLANLSLYGIEMCLEWKRRGYKDTQLQIFCRCYGYWSEGINVTPVVFSDALYASHRAALLAKNPAHYKQFKWKEKPEIKYVWK